MFTVTRSAAKEIKSNAQRGDTEELALRIAATQRADGSITYQMGFDEISISDVVVSSAGVDVVIADSDKPLLNGVVLDYVELEPGQFQFIFMNPNDPHHAPPAD